MVKKDWEKLKMELEEVELKLFFQVIITLSLSFYVYLRSFI